MHVKVRNKITSSVNERYSEVFNDDVKLNPLKTAPLGIRLKSDAVSFRTRHVRPIPIAYQQAAKDELDFGKREILRKITPDHFS